MSGVPRSSTKRDGVLGYQQLYGAMPRSQYTQGSGSYYQQQHQQSGRWGNAMTQHPYGENTRYTSNYLATPTSGHSKPAQASIRNGMQPSAYSMGENVPGVVGLNTRAPENPAKMASVGVASKGGSDPGKDVDVLKQPAVTKSTDKTPPTTNDTAPTSQAVATLRAVVDDTRTKKEAVKAVLDATDLKLKESKTENDLCMAEYKLLCEQEELADKAWTYVDSQGREQGPMSLVELLELRGRGAVDDTLLINNYYLELSVYLGLKLGEYQRLLGCQAYCLQSAQRLASADAEQREASAQYQIACDHFNAARAALKVAELSEVKWAWVEADGTFSKGFCPSELRRKLLDGVIQAVTDVYAVDNVGFPKTAGEVIAEWDEYYAVAQAKAKVTTEAAKYTAPIDDSEACWMWFDGTAARGPFRLQELRSHVQFGHIFDTTQVYQQRLPEQKYQLRELLDIFAQQTWKSSRTHTGALGDIVRKRILAALERDLKRFILEKLNNELDKWLKSAKDRPRPGSLNGTIGVKGIKRESTERLPTPNVVAGCKNNVEDEASDADALTHTSLPSPEVNQSTEQTVSPRKESAAEPLQPPRVVPSSTVLCNCNEPCILVASRKPGNQHRQYYRCPKYGKGFCGFRRWSQDDLQPPSQEDKQCTTDSVQIVGSTRTETADTLEPAPSEKLETLDSNVVNNPNFIPGLDQTHDQATNSNQVGATLGHETAGSSADLLPRQPFQARKGLRIKLLKASVLASPSSIPEGSEQEQCLTVPNSSTRHFEVEDPNPFVTEEDTTTALNTSAAVELHPLEKNRSVPQQTLAPTEAERPSSGVDQACHAASQQAVIIDNAESTVDTGVMDELAKVIAAAISGTELVALLDSVNVPVPEAHGSSIVEHRHHSDVGVSPVSLGPQALAPTAAAHDATQETPLCDASEPQDLRHTSSNRNKVDDSAPLEHTNLQQSKAADAPPESGAAQLTGVSEHAATTDASKQQVGSSLPEGNSVQQTKVADFPLEAVAMQLIGATKHAATSDASKQHVGTHRLLQSNNLQQTEAASTAGVGVAARAATDTSKQHDASCPAASATEHTSVALHAEQSSPLDRLAALQTRITEATKLPPSAGPSALQKPSTAPAPGPASEATKPVSKPKMPKIPKMDALDDMPLQSRVIRMKNGTGQVLPIDRLAALQTRITEATKLPPSAGPSALQQPSTAAPPGPAAEATKPVSKPKMPKIPKIVPLNDMLKPSTAALAEAMKPVSKPKMPAIPKMDALDDMPLQSRVIRDKVNPMKKVPPQSKPAITCTDDSMFGSSPPKPQQRPPMATRSTHIKRPGVAVGIAAALQPPPAHKPPNGAVKAAGIKRRPELGDQLRSNKTKRASPHPPDTIPQQLHSAARPESRLSVPQPSSAPPGYGASAASPSSPWAPSREGGLPSMWPHMTKPLRRLHKAGAAGHRPPKVDKKSLMKVKKKGQVSGMMRHTHGCIRAAPFTEAVKLCQYANQHQSVQHALRHADKPVLGGIKDAKLGATKITVERSSRNEKRQLVKSDAVSDAVKWNLLKARATGVRFGRSKVHAWGLFATEVIEPEQFVVEYVGDLVRSEVAERREQYYERCGLGSSYLFRVDDDWVVDATKKGGIARFINHSCDPNCYTKIITVEGTKHIVIYSKRSIQPGEELFYDYKFDYEDESQKVPCTCGAKNCRLYMN